MSLPRAKKSYSQNWLVDEGVIEKIIEAAQVAPGERVVEIGPGTGVLTQALVDTGAQVTAIEADASLVPSLCKRFNERVELIEGDALAWEASEGFGEYTLVANIPYAITSDILRRFLTANRPPKAMILMVQREVADRITAEPPNMSLLSVMCQLYARCFKVINVKAGAFRPIPKVDSAVVRLELDPHGSEEAVVALAKKGFSSRRKQLKKNLGPESVAALEAMGLNPKIRAQELTMDNWKELTHNLLEK